MSLLAPHGRAHPANAPSAAAAPVFIVSRRLFSLMPMLLIKYCEMSLFSFGLRFLEGGQKTACRRASRWPRMPYAPISAKIDIVNKIQMRKT